MKAPMLPYLLSVAAEAAGIDAAVQAARALGGKRIYIPQKASPNDPLTLAIGIEAAEAICRAMGGEHVEFPKGGAHVHYLIARDLVAKGASANKMVEVLKITYRHARRLRRMVRQVNTGDLVVAMRRPRDPRQIDIEDILRKT